MKNFLFGALAGFALIFGFILHKKTLLDFGFFDKFYFSIFYILPHNRTLVLGDTKNIARLMSINNVNNSHAYRVYAFSMAARYDLYHLGYIKSDKDILCTDQVVFNTFIKDKKSGEFVCNKNFVAKLTKHLKNFTKEDDLQERKSGVGFWVGENPSTPEMSGWATFSEDISENEVGSPLVYKSKEMWNEIVEIKKIQRSATKEKLSSMNYWVGQKGVLILWLNLLDELYPDLEEEKMFKMKVLVLMSGYSSSVSVWSTKFKFWSPRPTMVDGSIKLNLPLPNFPSYPSGHTGISSGVVNIIKNCFDVKNKVKLDKMLQEVEDSRILAGVHFKTDNMGGRRIGEVVAENISKKYCNI